MIALTKADLRDLHGLVTAHQPPGRKVTLAAIVRAGELATKLERLVVEMRPVLEKGPLVVSWRVPREQALTMNEYAYKKGWQKTKLRQELDAALRALFPPRSRRRICTSRSGSARCASPGSRRRRWTT